MKHVSQSGEEKRPYHSHVRQRQAEETRRRILVAARELFGSRGYAATTLEAIAELAEVSPKTVTAVFGSKLALLAEVINPEAFSPRARQLIEELPILFFPSTFCQLACFQEEHKDLRTYAIGCLGKLTGMLFPRRTHCPC